MEGHFQDLLSLLFPFAPSYDGQDIWQWSPGADGTFIVRSLFEMITSHTAEPHDIPMNWCRLVPKKVNIFIWQATRNLIPARTYLHNHRFNLDTLQCPLCSSHMETVDHILISCSSSREIWRHISLWCNTNVQDLLLSKDLLTLESQQSHSSKRCLARDRLHYCLEHLESQEWCGDTTYLVASILDFCGHPGALIPVDH